jgi:hypothetical protein
MQIEPATFSGSSALALQAASEMAGQFKDPIFGKDVARIRTPLNAIIETAELQMLTDLIPQQRRNRESFRRDVSIS